MQYDSHLTQTQTTPMSSLNARYVHQLHKRPLATKQVTAGVLAVLNEIIALTVTGEDAVLKTKLVVMALFSSMVTTPLTHFMYRLINTRLFRGSKLSAVQRILQLFTSLVTVTPLMAALFTAGIALVNQYLPRTLLVAEIMRVRQIATRALSKNYWKVLQSMLVTSGCSIVFAQRFVPNELWQVFFSLIQFGLGTYQNIRLKQSHRRHDSS